MAFFEQIGKKISDAGQGISQSTKNMAEISRLNNTISENKKHIAGYYAALGESYYKRHKDDPNNEEPERVNNINRLMAEIARCEEEIKQRRGIGKCPNCGSDVPQGAAFCNTCGARVAPPAPAPAQGRPCPNCGNPVPDGNRFCTTCGTMMPDPEPSPAPGPVPVNPPQPEPAWSPEPVTVPVTPPMPPEPPRPVEPVAPVEPVISPESPAPVAPVAPPAPAAEPEPVTATEPVTRTEGSPVEKLCPACGGKVEPGMRFCTSCGTRLE